MSLYSNVLTDTRFVNAAVPPTHFGGSGDTFTQEKPVLVVSASFTQLPLQFSSLHT